MNRAPPGFTFERDAIHGQLAPRFHDFVETVFGARFFEEWAALGFCDRRYRTYSLLEAHDPRSDGPVVPPRIVANAAACLLELRIRGDRVPAIQLATVGTRSEYRGRGLARWLLERVLDDFSDRFAFLFGNADVLAFYPRFGFRPVEESLFAWRPTERERHRASTERTVPLWRIRFRERSDREVLMELWRARRSNSTRFAPIEYDFIFAFHALFSFPDQLYFDQAAGIAAALSVADGLLTVHEMIATAPPPLEWFAIGPNGEPVREVHFAFTPDAYLHRVTTIDSGAESPVFVRGSLPLEPRSFKFPAAAQT